MIKYLVALLFLLTACKSENPAFRVISYNIRLNLSSDSLNAWPNRRDDVFGLLRFHQAEIFGLQEVLPDQMTEFEAAFPDFVFAVSGREDGERKGEGPAIGLAKSRFTLKQSGHFFLSETPEKPSLGWDAAYIRPVIWTVAEDKATGKSLLVISAHLDNQGSLARKKGAEQIARFISGKSGIHFVVLTGDFNTTLGSGELDGLVNSGLLSVYDQKESAVYGPDWSFQGFGSVPFAERQLIDYIFISANLKTIRTGILTDKRANDLWPSDHCPVLTELHPVP
ncbi:MAG: endonuclease/exonuclease/phosphatase family protein [Bacteroidetes bacterium]|nr:endonuclease/exonuclease/phosphatase family protein [Bacteroidota bacterium]